MKKKGNWVVNILQAQKATVKCRFVARVLRSVYENLVDVQLFNFRGF